MLKCRFSLSIFISPVRRVSEDVLKFQCISDNEKKKHEIKYNIIVHT